MCELILDNFIWYVKIGVNFTGFGNPLSKNEFSYENKDTMYFPDSRGNLYLINLKGADDPSNRATEKPVIFNLFTR